MYPMIVNGLNSMSIKLMLCASSRRLQFNPDKTTLIWFVSRSNLWKLLDLDTNLRFGSVRVNSGRLGGWSRCNPRLCSFHLNRLLVIIRAETVCRNFAVSSVDMALSRPVSFNQYSSRTNANKHLRIHHHLRVLVSRGLYIKLLLYSKFAARSLGTDYLTCRLLQRRVRGFASTDLWHLFNESSTPSPDSCGWFPHAW